MKTKLIVYGILSGLVTGILEALIFTFMWSKFVVPLGVPAIGFAQAFGLVLLVSLLIFRARMHQDLPPIEIMKNLISGFFQTLTACAFTIVFGFLASLYL